MKFTIFTLIAGLCLVAVTANATDDSFVLNDEVDDYEYIAQDLAEDVMEIEPRWIFSGTYRVIKSALRTLKGLNCTIKEVLAIQTAAQNFIDNVHACGGEVSKKVQNLIKACNDILKTCEDILGINESICGNMVDGSESAAQTSGVISNTKTAPKCAAKMLKKVQTLNKQIKYAIKLINQIKKVPGDTKDCAMNAVTTLESYFTQFLGNIKTCSKLTN